MDKKLQKTLAGYFLEGIYETTSTMTGFNLFEGGVDEQEEQNDEIAGAMFVAGTRNLLLVISTKKISAATFVMYMTGIEFDEQEDSMLYDGMAEIVNMVAGVAKAKLSDSGEILKLSSPFSIIGSDIKLVLKTNVEKYEYILRSNEVEINMGIYYI